MQPAQLGALLERRLADAREALNAVEDGHQLDWEHIVSPLDKCLGPLHQVWNTVVHLTAVADSDELRAVHEASLQKLSKFATDMAQSLPLYTKYKSLANSPAFQTYSTARQRVVENALRNFHRAGVTLPSEQRQRVAEIRLELAKYRAQFERNVLDATQAFSLFVDDEQDLHGVPESILTTARAAAARQGRSGWLLSLDGPCVWGVLDHAYNRRLREQIYRAFQTRCSEQGPSQLSNADLITKILSLRAESASLLGFASYGHCVMADRMMTDPFKVLGFLRQLAAQLRPIAELERKARQHYARTQFGIDVLEPWDAPFVAEKMKEREYGWSSDGMRSHFPADLVLLSLYRLVHEVYGVYVRPCAGEVWHSDVRHVCLIDESGALLGEVYLDLYARAGKRGGAWVSEYRGRSVTGGTVEAPIVFLCCNFGRGSDSAAAMLRHKDVLALFHEFGHCLHHVLTEVGEFGVCGVRGVEWDAIELPSQLMENFAWEERSLALMGEHVSAHPQMSEAIARQLRAAKDFHNALRVMRLIEFSLIDLELHTKSPCDWLEALRTVDDVRAEIGLFPQPDYNRFLTSFSHIFHGGYGAGYYAYVWSEMLSADVYATFKASLDDIGTAGRRFRREILAMGGSRPIAEGIRAFLGRMPDSSAYLRACGLAPETG